MSGSGSGSRWRTSNRQAADDEAVGTGDIEGDAAWLAEAGLGPLLLVFVGGVVASLVFDEDGQAAEGLCEAAPRPGPLRRGRFEDLPPRPPTRVTW